MISNRAPFYVEKKAVYRRRNSAFTLLEILVVLAIMAGLLSVTSVFYRQDDGKELQYQVSQNLRLFLQHKIDQTWLDGITYGLQVTPQTITVYQLDLNDSTWVETDSAWQSREEKIQILLTSSDSLQDEPVVDSTTSQEDVEEQKMDIVFMSSGEYTPFVIQVEYTNIEQRATLFTLEGDGVNALQILEN